MPTRATVQTPFRRSGRLALSILLVGSAATALAQAEDLTTLSGTVYHQVQMVRVEPDGVIWQHATGQCKVDFTDLPEAVRKTYHYDAKQAAAYQTAQAQSSEKVAEQTRQNQQEAAAWRTKRLQEKVAAADPEAKPGVFDYRRRAAVESGVPSVSESIASKTAARDLLTKDDGTVWDRRLWAIPCLLVGGYSPGVGFDPQVDLNPHEYTASLHHGPGGFAEDSLHDSFYQPDYLTKSYNQETDRAAALVRGRP